ncbi:hypothetical protein [Runella sp.]|uniref:hypothetical protein n=1 Tax=Runella sp. TaxID=1960881 RepID=UPI003D0BD232
MTKQQFKSARIEYLAKNIILLPFPLMIIGMAVFYGQELNHIYPLPFLIILSFASSEVLVKLKKL